MKFMDMAAGASAMKYARSNCVTARVDELVFHIPIFVGAQYMYANIAWCRQTRRWMCMWKFTLRIWSRETASRRLLCAHFTMVSMNRANRPQKSAAVYSGDG